MRRVKSRGSRREGQRWPRRSSFVMRWRYVLLLGALLGLALGATAVWDQLHRPEPLTYTQFATALDRGQIATLSIQPGERITGQWRAASARATSPYGFTVVYPQLDASGVLARAEKAGVPVSFDAPPDKERNKTLLAILVQVVL